MVSSLAMQQWQDYSNEYRELEYPRTDCFLCCGPLGDEDFLPYCSWRCYHEEDDAREEELYETWLRLRAPLSPLVDWSGEGKAK